MKKSRLMVAACVYVFALCLSDLTNAATVTFTPLGDLADGTYDSYAEHISADGSVVVGSSFSASGREILLKTITAMPKNSIAVDISFLEKGIYLISFENQNGSRFTKSFIKN